MTDPYRQLATHLDNLPAGFPSTESGVELRILKKLFTPDQARIATGLAMMPEPVKTIARRLKVDEAELAPVLEEMSRQGLIFRASRKEGNFYMAAQFVIGIWEYNLNNLDAELIRDVNEYLPFYMNQGWLKADTKQLRVIPIAKGVDAEMAVTSYEAAEAIVKAQSKIVVSDCICRKEHGMVGKGCGKPVEVCLAFGTGAYYYEQNGLGRSISQAEALSILKIGEAAGLVLQPGNSRKPMNICMCCGCCCQVLKNLNTLEKPARVVHTNFYAEVIEDECTACGACVDRCQMGAICVEDTARIDLDRCIGCGLCVTDCPTKAMVLRQKEDADRYEPPANVVETYMRMAGERGLV